MANPRTTQVTTLAHLVEKDVWRAVTFVLGATTDIARDCLCSKDDVLQGEARLRAFKHCLEVAIRELQQICESLDVHAGGAVPLEAQPPNPVKTPENSDCESLQPRPY